jgi:hypothetical protein
MANHPAMQVWLQVMYSNESMSLTLNHLWLSISSAVGRLLGSLVSISL